MLPPLKGTEKQVKWSETIREKKLKEWQREAGTNPALVEALQNATGRTDSGFWISYRESKLKDVEKHLRTGHNKVEADREKFRKEQAKEKGPGASGPNLQTSSQKPAGIPSSSLRKPPESKMWAGPIRNVETGEIVDHPDPEIPF